MFKIRPHKVQATVLKKVLTKVNKGLKPASVVLSTSGSIEGLLKVNNVGTL